MRQRLEEPVAEVLWPSNGQGWLPDVSFVLPAHNEETNLGPLLQRIEQVTTALGLRAEVVIVDDGSNDGTWQVAHELQRRHPQMVLVRHRRRSGEAAALASGFRVARGRVLVTMDADLQDEPEHLPRLLAKLDEGYDLVTSWRWPRADGWGKRLPSALYNWLQRRLFSVPVHDAGSGLRAFRPEVAKGLPLYGGLHRYMPALTAWRGYSVAEVKVGHRPRAGGRSNYGPRRLASGLLDLLTVHLLTHYLSRPLHGLVRWGLLAAAFEATVGGAGVAAGLATGQWGAVVTSVVAACAATMAVLAGLAAGLACELLSFPAQSGDPTTTALEAPPAAPTRAYPTKE
ncbi:MAG TPA: glycosyltransferase family 2 protein [Dehalococcoidia bacterium]|nr:glycosyltransferase family 2 protein [Dehalococcoidia bacterium]